MSRTRWNSVALALAGVATIVNPYGPYIYKEVFSAVTSSSLANNMAEFLPPNFQDAGQWPFLLAILGTVALFSMGTRRIQLPWPAWKRKCSLFNEFARLDPGSRVGILAVPTAILLLWLGLNRGQMAGLTVIPDRFSPKAFPTEAVSRARAASLPGRVFDAWGWGGYIMYAWPEARLHVDPLKFNAVTIAPKA